MIYIVSPGHSEQALDIVTSAVERSCGFNQIQRISYAQWQHLQKENNQDLITILINPLNEWTELIINNFNTKGNKTIIFGALSCALASYLGAKIISNEVEKLDGSICDKAAPHNYTTSRLQIKYLNSTTVPSSPIQIRPFRRYDFSDEWNNLGFGEIRTDHSIWSISQIVEIPEDNLVACIDSGDAVISAYAGFWINTKAATAAIWFNRAVGPIDSQEWQVVERFISTLGYPEIVCQPVLSEIPYGYDAAVTMRLDCDESIESARPLWEEYKRQGVPFSLALHTSVLRDSAEQKLPRQVLETGGAILSHTATHAPNWGGSYCEAYREAISSREKIEDVTGFSVKYAVSPFHQTPEYARAALADAGYLGCIGGIVNSDVDFIMARSGRPVKSALGFIGHNQQCMLHGDCMLAMGDPLKVYKEAFDIAKKSQTLFGYLDHPFSARYNYGWVDENERIKKHRDFITYMKQGEKTLFINEHEAMNFLYDRANIEIEKRNKLYEIKMRSSPMSKYIQSFQYGGKNYEIQNPKIII